VSHMPGLPDAPSTLQDTLTREHFIDALPESEVQCRIHQARPKSLREAFTATLEIDRHQAKVQARAVFPPVTDYLAPNSSLETDLQQQVKELQQVVNHLLAAQEPLSPTRNGLPRIGSGQLPNTFSGSCT